MRKDLEAARPTGNAKLVTNAKLVLDIYIGYYLLHLNVIVICGFNSFICILS